MNGTVLITGSGRGLGKELALVFAEHGYGIILHDRKRSDVEEVKAEISQKKVVCLIASGDLKLQKTLDALYKISKENDVSILVNNAGVHCLGLPLEKINDSYMDDLLMTNLLAPMKLMRRIYPLFLKKKMGTIINMNSISGLENQKLRTVYCASKWGLRGFTDTLRLEAKERNIRILDVYPSRIKTRPQFKYGMEPREVAHKIYKAYENTKNGKIILDDRPQNRRNNTNKRSK